MSTATPDLKAKLEQVNEQIADKTTEAQKKWAEFEQHRDQFASAGNDANRTDTDEFKKAEETHKGYATAAEELKELERVRTGIFGMLGTGPVSEGLKDTALDTVERLSPGERKTLGERIVESEGYKALKASGALDSERMAFNQALGDRGSVSELKALITGVSDTSGGAFVDADRQPYVPQPRRQRRILDLITTGETGSDQVKYARQTTFTNVAAETAEATVTTTGTKPEATIAFEVVTADVKTIAHWVPATRRSLSDIPQMRTLIDSQLRYGLEYRLESQVVNGDGTGENLTGILNTANIQSQALSGSIADTVHKGITKIRLAFLEPNGVGLHPNDWELVRLSRDDGGATAGTGAYLYGPPSTAGAETMWGLPVAVTAAVPDDTGIVADFRQATLWLREGMQVLASDSHDDFFVKNLIAVLAEMRAAFGVLLPAAVCKLTSLD